MTAYMSCWRHTTIFFNMSRRSASLIKQPISHARNASLPLANLSYTTTDLTTRAARHPGIQPAKEMSTTKSILITGCSADGIGAAMALVLAKRGHHVFATARDTSKIPESLRSLSNVTTMALDVADPSSIAASARAVADSGRGLQVLVNNAGGGYVRPVLDIDIAAAQRLFDINLWGPLRMIQAFAGLLISSRGRIVNVSSSAAVINSPWYCMSGPVSLGLSA